MAGDRFFEHVERFLADTLSKLSKGFSDNYSSILSDLFPSAVTLYILFKAYQILAGKIQSPVADIIWDLASKVMILAFVTNYGGYLSLALGAVDGLKESFVGNDSIFSLLDDQLEIAQTLAGTIYSLDESDYVPIAGAIGSGAVWLGAGIALLTGGIILLVTEITLKLLAITAPIFIFCLMWGFLRQMFNQWLQLIAANIITVLYISIVGRLGIGFFKKILNDLMNNLGTEKASSAGIFSSGTVAEASLYTSGFIALCTGIIIGVFLYLSLDIGRNLATVSVEGTATALANSSLGRSLGITKQALEKFLSGGRRFGRGMGRGFNNTDQKVLPSNSYSERAGIISGRAGRNLINMLRNQGGRNKKGFSPPTK
ncbi:TPA: type IV secretion system protein [Pasteurella multocida]|nr:type IV secretion system protein [Pasteurella multocida]HDX1177500.1 type IV secretion system protein [Pasteurella multocida]